SRKMHLHARRLVIDHPDGPPLDVTADLPEHFAKSMEQLGFTLADGSIEIAPAPEPTRETKKRAAKAHAKQYRKERRGERRSRTRPAPKGPGTKKSVGLKPGPRKPGGNKPAGKGKR
ncbi:MAG: hypothetical protein KDF64_01495, partial [Geminicoccaceae bacterium]|nr:hypothetical protein [Geminicoccaceae bacterium]